MRTGRRRPTQTRRSPQPRRPADRAKTTWRSVLFPSFSISATTPCLLSSCKKSCFIFGCFAMKFALNFRTKLVFKGRISLVGRSERKPGREAHRNYLRMFARGRLMKHTCQIYIVPLFNCIEDSALSCSIDTERICIFPASLLATMCLLPDLFVMQCWWGNNNRLS